MRSAFIAAAALAGSAAVFAQAPVDFSRTPLRQAPLQFPARAVEEGVPSVPAMGIYKPSGPGPFPAVVVVHPCGGIGDHIGEWAKSLVAAGYVALVMDSFTQRNLRDGENCKLPARIHPVEGALDAYGHRSTGTFTRE